MTNPNYTPSPLEELVIRELGGRTFIREQVISVATTRTSIMPNNPNRLAWSIENESVNDMRFTTDPGITSTSGWLLSSNGGYGSMIYLEDGEATGQEVYAIALVAAGNLRVREVIRL